MAELNLKQITNKLNEEFQGDVRKLVFWYDANAEFIEDIDNIELKNAKVLRLERDNQFYIKYFLEREDKETNYLVYAPFAKPPIRENHLADTIRYSKEFFADLASIIILDLGIDEKYKPVIQQHIKFFKKANKKKFYELEIDSFDKSTIEIAMMSVICKNKAASFEEVMRCILIDGGLADNKYLAEFEKYNLLDSFWQYAETAFGYSDYEPTLEKLAITLFVTYASKVINADMPTAWKPFISYKSGNIISFLDDLMNNYLYSEKYDELSEMVYNAVNAKTYLAKMDAAALVGCNIFAGVDDLVIAWLLARLENEDVGAKLDGMTIPEICADRRKKHFGIKYRNEYFVIENARRILASGRYEPISGIENIIRNYTESAYKIDRGYRYFYYYLDRVEDETRFEKLRDLVENIYTTEYLNKITANWTAEFDYADGDTGLVSARDFFSKYVSYVKGRTVVIISDAFRYEAARSLFDELQLDKKCTASIMAMQGVLPSYTPLGMAALLPHKKIEYNDKLEVTVDGKICATTEQRAAQLKKYKPKSKCMPFDSFKNMNPPELKDVFKGQDVVYVYHNQVDARGDSVKTENEVFEACEEAIKEIHAFIRRISSLANSHHFLITADHGFIYKRDKIRVSDKISGASSKSICVGQRYVIADEPLDTDGVCSISLGTVLGNDDGRIVSYPIASDIFKVAGAGQNYVHGGCSPQEMLVPVVDVKVKEARKGTDTKIALVSLTNKITNLITTLDFVQTEPVSDTVKEVSYSIYFISEDNERISNENICIADKKEHDTAKRMFRFRFRFKNMQYNKSRKYFLVAVNTQSHVEVLRHEVIMDIAFADDFGFLR